MQLGGGGGGGADINTVLAWGPILGTVHSAVQCPGQVTNTVTL